MKHCEEGEWFSISDLPTDEQEPFGCEVVIYTFPIIMKLGMLPLTRFVEGVAREGGLTLSVDDCEKELAAFGVGT